MSGLANKIAVITGASRGIGRSIALELASQGTILCLVGRNLQSLDRVALKAQEATSKVKSYRVDLAQPADIQQLAKALKQDFAQVDLLIHSAGAYSRGPVQHAPIQALDDLYQINFRAPYLLTQLLLPRLLSSQGQIVFVNSSAVMRAMPNLSQYSATKAALKAFADSLRAEVNLAQVRVLSVYPGRTATPLQASICEMEGQPFVPEKLLQPEDIAAVVVNALSLPRTVEVTDIHLRPLADPLT
jgi:short-subunit dehydrogenase